MAIDEDEGVVFAVGDLILDVQTACRNAELTDKWEMCMSSDYPKEARILPEIRAIKERR